jgi:hypothetical protein
MNLAEFHPESGTAFIAHLASGDLLSAWRVFDDEHNARWVGYPLRELNADRPRIAFCNGAPTGKTISAYLDVNTTGTAITVSTMVAQTGECPNATFDLDDCIPRLKDDDPIMVTKVGATWYCTTVFQPSED